LLSLLDVDGVVEKQNYSFLHVFNANRNFDLNDGRSIYVSRSSDHIPEENLHREQWKFEELEGLQVPVDISPDFET